MSSFGMEDFAKKYGTLEPSQFVDVVSLVGDKSDNIPGSFMFQRLHSLGASFLCEFISFFWKVTHA